MTTHRKSDQPFGAVLGQRHAFMEALKADPVPQAPPTDAGRDEGRRIAVGLIDPNPFQPRRSIEPGDQEHLVASLQSQGLLQAIVVRPQGSRFELVAGQRRLQAAKSLGWATIPAHVRTMTDRELREASLMENLQRADLNPLDEAQATFDLLCLELNADGAQVRSLLSRMRARTDSGSGDNVVTEDIRRQIEDFFRRIGTTSPEAFRTHKLPLLALPEDIQEAIREGLDYTKARLLARVPDPERRRHLQEQAQVEAWPLPRLKEAIDDRPGQAHPSPTGEVHSVEGRLRALVHSASQRKGILPQSHPRIFALITELESLLHGPRVSTTAAKSKG